FSGDKQQLLPLIKAALTYKGFALIDVISPCITFNNHQGSTKSYSHVRSHDDEVTAVDFIPVREEIVVEYGDGEAVEVPLHDGSSICLRKVIAGYDPSNRGAAMQYIQEQSASGEIVTGLSYIDVNEHEMHEIMNTTNSPLRDLSFDDLCPGAA